jgi:hypothetical protein
VLDRGPVFGVHRDPAPLVGLETGQLEAEVVRLTLASCGIEHDVGGDPLPARELGQCPLAVALDGGHFFAQAEDDSQVAQVVLQTLRYLGVAEVEQARPLLDKRDLPTERGEHRGVLDADDARADDENGRRDSVEQEQSVGIEDRRPVELDRGRPRRTRSRCNDEPLRGQPPLLVIRDGDGVRIEEACAPLKDLNVVPHQLVADDVDLALDHLLRPEAEIIDRDLLLHPVALAVGRLLAQSGEVDDGLTERLRGDRPPVDRHATELATLDEGDGPAELCRLDRCLLSGRPGSDDEEFVLVAHRLLNRSTPFTGS